MTVDFVRCFSCGAEVPHMDGPTHPYLESSPGCWHVFGEVLARQFSDPTFGTVQRPTADAFAVQHPGRPSPVAIQSVCGQLLSLCVVLDHGAAYSYADHVLQAAVKGKIPFRWLTPPHSLGDVTVADVRAAVSPDEYMETVHAWIRSAWSAWADHHEIVRTWVAAV